MISSLLPLDVEALSNKIYYYRTNSFIYENTPFEKEGKNDRLPKILYKVCWDLQQNLSKKGSKNHLCCCSFEDASIF